MNDQWFPELERRRRSPPGQFKSAPVFEKQILARLMKGLCVLGAVAYAPNAYASYVSGLWVLLAVTTIGYIAVALAALHPRATARVQAATIIVGSGIIGVVTLLSTGQSGAGFMWLMVMVIFSAAFGSVRTTIVAVAILVSVVIAYAALVALEFSADGESVLEITVIGANVALMSVSVAYVVNQLISRLRRLADHQTKLVDRLEQELGDNHEIQRSLKRTLDDKRSALHELDHRVRNNLQVISSLVHMAERSRAPHPLRDLRLRIDSMATIHHLLDPTGDARHVGVSALVRQVYQRVDAAYHTPDLTAHIGGRDSGDVETGTGAYVEVDRAIHLALACTEIFANAMKHAFNGIADPRIDVDIETVKNDIVIGIRDNGNGNPDELSPESLSGINLIRAVLEQMGASIRIRALPGFGYTISLPRSPQGATPPEVPPPPEVLRPTSEGGTRGRQPSSS